MLCCEDFQKMHQELERPSDETTWEIACEEMYEILGEAKVLASKAIEKINSLTVENSS